MGDPEDVVDPDEGAVDAGAGPAAGIDTSALADRVRKMGKPLSGKEQLQQLRDSTSNEFEAVIEVLRDRDVQFECRTIYEMLHPVSQMQSLKISALQTGEQCVQHFAARASGNYINVVREVVCKLGNSRVIARLGLDLGRSHGLNHSDMVAAGKRAWGLAFSVASRASWLGEYYTVVPPHNFAAIVSNKWHP